MTRIMTPGEIESLNGLSETAGASEGADESHGPKGPLDEASAKSHLHTADQWRAHRGVSRRWSFGVQHVSVPAHAGAITYVATARAKALSHHAKALSHHAKALPPARALCVLCVMLMLPIFTDGTHALTYARARVPSFGAHRPQTGRGLNDRLTLSDSVMLERRRTAWINEQKALLVEPAAYAEQSESVAAQKCSLFNARASMFNARSTISRSQASKAGSSRGTFHELVSLI
jgi:hypothetical protein